MSAIGAETSLHLQRQQTQLIWTKINELRRTATLCDVVLKSVEGTTFMAHRLILVTSAKYFANALLNTEPWVVPVNLPEVLITPVLDYLYGEKISVGKDLLPQIASMAEFLGIEELKGSCEQAMQSGLSQPTQSAVSHLTQSGLSQPTQSDLLQTVHPELSHLTQPDVPQPLQSDVDVVASMLSGNNSSSVDPKADANKGSTVTTTEQSSQEATPAVNCNSTSGEEVMATDRGATQREGERKQGNNRRPCGLKEGSIKLESLKDLPDILACLNPREREAVNTAMKMVEQHSLQTEAHSEETDQEAGVLANVPLHGIMGRLEKPKDSTRMGSGSASKRKSKPRHIVQIRPRVTVDELVSPPGKRKRGRPRQSAPSQPKITKVKRKRKSKPKSSSKSKPEKDYVPHNQPKNFDKTSYVCKLCHSSFTLAVSAKKHMLQQHRYRRKTGFYLQLRRYRYVGSTGIHRGRRKERKTWPCHKCFKTFTDQLHLDLHTRLKHQTLGRPSKRSSSVRTHNREKVLGTWTAFQLKNLLTRPYFCGKIVSQKRPLRARSSRRVPSLQKKSIRSAISKLKKTCVRTKTKPLLQCHHCEEKFKSRIGLEEHIQIMHGSSICDQCGEEVAQKQMALHMAETHGLGHRFYKDKECEKCQQTFQLKEIFKFHWKQTHDIDVFPCAAKECDEYFLSYTAWCRHMQRHEKAEYTCEFCEYSSSLQMNLQKHVRECHVRPYTCDACGQRFGRDKYLWKHQYRDHGIVAESLKVLYCDFDGCDYTALFRSDLQSHKLKHKEVKNEQCTVCGKLFKNLRDVRKHMRVVHERRGSRVCTYCGKTLLGRLDLHEQRCLGIAKLSCKLCDYKASEKQYLDDHQFYKHGILPPNKKVLKCELCDFQTLKQYIFERHVARHSGIKAHICSVCGKGVTTIQTLKRHMIIHTGERLFPCLKCDYKAPTAKDLRTHVRVKHEHPNAKPYKCGFCHFRANLRSNCRKHIHKYHPGGELKIFKLSLDDIPAIDEEEERALRTQLKKRATASKMAKAASARMTSKDLTAATMSAVMDPPIPEDPAKHGNFLREMLALTTPVPNQQVTHLRYPDQPGGGGNGGGGGGGDVQLALHPQQQQPQFQPPMGLHPFLSPHAMHFSQQQQQQQTQMYDQAVSAALTGIYNTPTSYSNVYNVNNTY